MCLRQGSREGTRARINIKLREVLARYRALERGYRTSLQEADDNVLDNKKYKNVQDGTEAGL